MSRDLTNFQPADQIRIDLKCSTSGFTDDGAAVVAVVDKFLGGLAKRDKAGMLVLSSGSATLVRNDGLIFTTLQGVVDRIPFDYPQEMSEIISAQPTVLVDREIAMAWTPYEFYFDGVVHHVGTGISSLLKQNWKWVISGWRIIVGFQMRRPRKSSPREEQPRTVEPRRLVYSALGTFSRLLNLNRRYAGESLRHGWRTPIAHLNGLRNMEQCTTLTIYMDNKFHLGITRHESNFQR
ncbi:hypothetical protein DFH08DRAFT_1000495 [Mycena albidolilacea]|uniref:Uncharacterized protein n=1 Tax=Mycena albidolilacea TaxID=1033008 RepID=A0AAD7A370_9AGAR|nr:hypothetical protein DFH08DRAFT_1000495 [Mycena albidolilacea]